MSDLWLTPFVYLQVTATDDDGPINNLLRYSIVSGDPLQQFSIHPRSGEITVRTALDREEVSVWKRLKHKKKRMIHLLNRIQIKRNKKLNFICLPSRSLITLWRCRQQMKGILLSPRRCSSPSLSPMSTTTHPSSLRLTTVCCCRYDNQNISHDMSVSSSHSQPHLHIHIRIRCWKADLQT